MQIAIDIPREKTDIMIEFLKSITFVKNISMSGNVAQSTSRRKREIGVLDGVGDVIFKDNWEMSEEELVGAI